MSELEQDSNRLTGNQAAALTTTVNSTFSLSKEVRLAKSNKTWFDKEVKKNIIRLNFSFNRDKRYRTPPKNQTHEIEKSRLRTPAVEETRLFW